MRLLPAAASAAAMCLLAGTALARPTSNRRQVSTTPSIEVTFSGGRSDAGALQPVGVMWPIDGQFYTPKQVAADFPSAQFGVAPPKRVDNAGQGVSSGNIVNGDAARVRCSFAGVDGTTHVVDSGPGKGPNVDGKEGAEAKPFTVTAPTAFTSGECHFAN